MQITFETRKRNTLFYILRQGVPEGRSSERYATQTSFGLGIGVIPGVDAVGLVTKKRVVPDSLGNYY